jgi:cytochrome c-type biogenesis protein CcmH
MMLFWILATVMLIAGLLMVLPSLLKHGKTQTVARDAVNAAVYKDQLAELEADLRNATLSPEQFEQGQRDLERNLLADVSVSQEQTPVTATVVGRNTAIVVALVIPLLAVGVYLQLGHSNQAFALPVNAQAEMPAAGDINPQAMVERLAKHLKQKPEDGAGWEMLGRSYRVLGRFNDASQAYANAVRLLDESSQLLADYAEVLALSSTEQQLAGKPTELFVKALKLDPDNQKALWLAGMAAFQKEDFSTARTHWTRLTRSLPADSEDARIINENIAEADARRGATVTR